MAQNKGKEKETKKKITIRYSSLWWSFAGLWLCIFLFFLALSQ